MSFQKRLLDKQHDSTSKKAKLSTSVAYKHSSVVPRDADVQNFRIFVGELRDAAGMGVRDSERYGCVSKEE